MASITLLVNMMRQWALFHAAMGIAHVILYYMLADAPTYGGAGGPLSYTPLGPLVEAALWQNPGLDIKQILDLVFAICNMIYSFISYEYAYLVVLTAESGFLYYLKIIVAMAGWTSSITALGGLAGVVVQSGILSSTAGLALVTLGAAVGGGAAVIGAGQ